MATVRELIDKLVYALKAFSHWENLSWERKEQLIQYVDDMWSTLKERLSK